MEKFYNVQIPYRGVIPIIRRRGPIASIELSESQVADMRLYGVEMLDPLTGKEFVADKKVEAEKPQVQVEPAVVAEPEPVIPEVAEPVAEEPVVEEPVKVEEPVAEPEEAPAVEAEADTDDDETESADDFDFTKIAGYSELSKNKQKAVRRKFRETYAKKKNLEEAVADATKMVESK